MFIKSISIFTYNVYFLIGFVQYIYFSPIIQVMRKKNAFTNMLSVRFSYNEKNFFFII